MTSTPCGALPASIWAGSRCRMKPRSAISGISWKPTTWGRAASADQRVSGGEWTERQDGYDCGCHTDRCAEFDEEQGRQAGSGDAPDEEGQSVVFWHEGAYWHGSLRAGPQSVGVPRGGSRFDDGRRFTIVGGEGDLRRHSLE